MHGSYAGAPAAQLLADRDQSVGIRFQAVFLPVKKGFGDAAAQKKMKLYRSIAVIT